MSARIPRRAAARLLLDAVRHLYTMCRHVKSIEIIELGFEKAQEGVNGAKSELVHRETAEMANITLRR